MSNTQETHRFIISEEYVSARVDKALGDLCPDLSRSRAKALIDEGCVTLNSLPLKTASRKCEIGDVLDIAIPAAVPCNPQAEDIPLVIVYEDDDLIVLNKAVGMVVHPGAGNHSGTLVNALLHYCGDTLSGIGGVIRPGIVHRLDKDTSGLMIVAKNDKAHRHLSLQLADRSLSRTYQAIVFKVPMPLKGRVEQPIGRHSNNRQKMCVNENGREAATRFCVKERFGDACALIECKLETGRTHQIRVHMSYIGHPLLGDPIYGPQRTGLVAAMKKDGYIEEIIEELLKFPRQALHAQSLSFIHPATDNVMSFSSDLPSDLANALKLLTK